MSALVAVPWVRRAVEGIAVILVYSALAVLLLYPLFNHPTRQVVDPAAEGVLMAVPDTEFLMWALAWGWHALTTAPLHLFDANIFHPAPLTLANSEHLLGHLVVFGPIYALSGNPVLAHQMNFLLAIALSGAAMYALLRHWGVAAPAAWFGGFVYAFAPGRAYSAVQVQLVTTQYVPLVMLYLDRTLTLGRVRSAVAFFAFLLVQALCSYYVAYMTATALIGYALGILWSTRGRLHWRGVVLAGVAALVAGIGVAAFSLPYLRLRSLGIIPDYVHLLAVKLPSNGLWRNYLYPPIAYRRFGFSLDRGLKFYLGIVPLAFAGAALIPRRQRPSGAAGWAPAAAFGAAFACYVMALGPDFTLAGRTVTLPYWWAMQTIPGFSSMRVPARFAIVLTAGFAALAGIGLDRMLQRPRLAAVGWGRQFAVVILLTAITACEYDFFFYRYPVRTIRVGSDLPPVYRALAEAPAGAVLEIPTGGRADLHGLIRESEYALYSTFHWHPLLNGYSGYYPPSYDAVVGLANALPDARATELLARATGLRYVVVHLTALEPAQQARWINPPGLRLLGSFDRDALFAVREAFPPDLIPALIDFAPRKQSVLGTPLTPVPEGARVAAVAFDTPPSRTAIVDMPVRFEVRVTNTSASTWPALVSVGTHLVSVGYRWESERGVSESEDLAAARLPYDLAPGDSVRVLVAARAPAETGIHRLVIGVTQDGEWFPYPLGPITLEVLPLELLRRMGDPTAAKR